MNQPAPKSGRIALESIELDGDTQSRASIDQSVIEDYAEQLKAGAKFPPITLYFDGQTHWIGDGFHRAHAYARAKRKVVPAHVHQGSQRDALLHSLGANANHGLRRTNEDKRNAVMIMLNDPEWTEKSDNWIAEACVVDHKTVAKYRLELASDLGNSQVKRSGMDGRTIDVSNIGPAPKPLCVQPSTPIVSHDERDPSPRPLPVEKHNAAPQNSEDPDPVVRAMSSSPMSAVECIIVQLGNPVFKTADGRAALKRLAQWCLDQVAPLPAPRPKGCCTVCGDPLDDYDAMETMCTGCRENAAAADANNADDPVEDESQDAATGINSVTPPSRLSETLAKSNEQPRTYQHEMHRIPRFKAAFEQGGALGPDGAGGYVMRMPDSASQYNGMTCSSRARSAMTVELGLDEVDDDVFAMPADGWAE